MNRSLLTGLASAFVIFAALIVFAVLIAGIGLVSEWAGL